ncbi:hypothetical protein V866_003467 [Kwoniella sp. B9012]|uniref:Uncharacterized protein n=1 Tax=Kwoniella europaea PYCC6329 TaxID=1423913 RepID=A0AAX4KG75_9TREE
MSAASTGTFDDSNNRAAMMDWSERKSIVENEIDELIEDILYHISSTHRTDPNNLKLSAAFKEQLYTEHTKHTATIAEIYRTRTLLGSDSKISSAYYRDGSLRYNIEATYILKSEYPTGLEAVQYPVKQTLVFPCSEMDLKEMGEGTVNRVLHHEEPVSLVPFVSAQRRDPIEVYRDSLSKRSL